MLSVGQPRSTIHQLEYARPEAWRISHRTEIGLFRKMIQPLVAALIKVHHGDLCFRGELLQCLTQIPGRGIVAVAESRRQYEYAFRCHMPYLGLGRLRSCGGLVKIG